MRSCVSRCNQTKNDIPQPVIDAWRSNIVVTTPHNPTEKSQDFDDLVLVEPSFDW